jgi:hypothetical protein
MPNLIEAVLEQRIPARSGDTSSAVRARGSSHADPVWHYVTKALLRHADGEKHELSMSNGKAESVDNDINGQRAVSTHAVVTVLERPTTHSAVILWRDSTRCHYADQIWCRCLSQRSGVCALSGRRIRRGDVVYRPRARKCPPLNAGDMILASSIEGDATHCTDPAPPKESMQVVDGRTLYLSDPEEQK